MFTGAERGSNSTSHGDVRDQKGAEPAPGWQFPPELPSLQLLQHTESVIGPTLPDIQWKPADQPVSEAV